MGFGSHELSRAWVCVGMGWAGHGVGMCWTGCELVWVWSLLDMGCVYIGLCMCCAWAGLGLGVAGTLGCPAPCAKLDPWLDYELGCAWAGQCSTVLSWTYDGHELG
jgi:hypothetical protein